MIVDRHNKESTIYLIPAFHKTFIFKLVYLVHHVVDDLTKLIQKNDPRSN